LPTRISMKYGNLKVNYEPRDEKAYADLETKFVQCEMESPDENSEKWINQLIKFNQRIESYYPSQKKSDVTMIAHVLSRFQRKQSTTRILWQCQGDTVTASTVFWNSREKFGITGNATSEQWQKKEKVKNKCTQ